MLVTISQNNLNKIQLNLINQIFQNDIKSNIILLWQAGIDNCYNHEFIQNLAAKEVYILELEAKARGIEHLLPPIFNDFGKKCILVNLDEFIALTEKYYPQASF